MSRNRYLALGWLVVAGCDSVFRIDEVAFDQDALLDSPGACTTAQATFEATSCGDVAFDTDPEEIIELSGSVVGDPTLRGDALELFYVRTSSPYAIAYATRPTATSAWTLVGDAPFDDMDANDVDPSVSADGAYVAFVSNRGGDGDHAFLAHRACNTWEVTQVPGIESVTVTGLDLTWDALGLYYSTAVHDVYQVHRGSLAEPFGTPTLVAQDAPFPAVSSDELELYLSSGAVYRETRATKTEMFGSRTLVIDMAVDPDLTVDGTTLLSAFSGQNVQLSRRTCP